MLRFALVLSIGLSAAFAQGADKSQPKSLDPALKIELFAEHPTIVTPTGIDVDHKGRVFAVESNTHFRPKDYKGHPSDRVLVLQDTNGDGKADKTTVFTDGLTHTMSVKVKPLWLDLPESGKRKAESGKKGAAFGFPLSAFVATRRAIYLYHDTNNDLKADKRERIVQLETKGNYPHNGLAGIAFDAMGWMYFGFGENLGAKYTLIGSDGTKLSGGGEGGNLYRCRPDGSKLSRWATGFWNPHASCVDAFGRLFTVDNDPDSRPPCRLLHIIEGGDYGFRFRNGRAGLHPFTAWNGEIPGTLPMVSGTGEAPSGIVAYESDGLPKKYIGNLLVGSWGDHRIDRFVLKPKGASFVSRPEPVIQGGEDFRPVGLAVAPDGSLFCTDWVKRDYKLHGHGRVWRISRKVEAKRKRIDLATITAKNPVKDLEKLLSHPRLEVRRMAARAIRQIGTKQAYEVMDDAFRSAKSSEKTRAEVLWQMARVRDHRFQYFTFPGEPQLIRKQMKPASTELVDVLFRILIQFPPQFPKRDGSPGLLGMTGVGVLAGETGETKTDDVHETQKLLARSTSVWVRLLQHVDWTLLPDRYNKESTEFWRKTLSRFLAKGDGFQSSALRTALSQPQWKPVVARLLNEKNKPPQLSVFLLLTERMSQPHNLEAARIGLKSESPDVRRVAVQWVAEENLKELKPQVEAVLNGKVMNADLFLATLAALEMLDGKRPQDFDKTPAGKYVLPLVKDKKRSPAVRAMALRLIDPNESRLLLNVVVGLLNSKDQQLRLETVRTLQVWNSAAAKDHLENIARIPGPVQLRAEAVLGLDGRGRADRDTQIALVSALYADDASVQVEALRTLRSYVKAEPKLMQVVEKFAKTPAAKRPPLSEQIAMLRGKKQGFSTKDVIAKKGGDAAAGRRVFFHPNSAGCYKCHTVNGRGGNIGPDLTTIARTADRRKLAESILEPSKEIAPQFTLWSFVMDDGKVHHGMILGDTRNGKRRQIGTPEGKIVELPLTQIELRKPQKKSPMPEKLIDQLTATEFRDLLAFLETLK